MKLKQLQTITVWIGVILCIRELQHAQVLFEEKTTHCVSMFSEEAKPRPLLQFSRQVVFMLRPRQQGGSTGISLL